MHKTLCNAQFYFHPKLHSTIFQEEHSLEKRQISWRNISWSPVGFLGCQLSRDAEKVKSPPLSCPVLTAPLLFLYRAKLIKLLSWMVHLFCLLQSWLSSAFFLYIATRVYAAVVVYATRTGSSLFGLSDAFGTHAWSERWRSIFPSSGHYITCQILYLKWICSVIDFAWCCLSFSVDIFLAWGIFTTLSSLQITCKSPHMISPSSAFLYHVAQGVDKAISVISSWVSLNAKPIRSGFIIAVPRWDEYLPLLSSEYPEEVLDVDVQGIWRAW